MKISKNEIRRLISEASRTPKNWDDYIAVGKNAEQKAERKRIKQRWETVGGNQKLYGNFKNLKSSPGNFDKTFMGWVKWYNTCRKDAAAMRLIDKKPGSHFSPTEMIKLYAEMVPGQKLAKAKKATDSEAVTDMLAGQFDLDSTLSQADDTFAKIVAIMDKQAADRRAGDEEEEFSMASAKQAAKSADVDDIEDEEDEKPGFFKKAKRFFSRKSDEKDLESLDESISVKRWQKLADL